MFGPEIFGLLYSIPLNFFISIILLDKGISLLAEGRIMLGGLYFLAFTVFTAWIIYSIKNFWEVYNQHLKK